MILSNRTKKRIKKAIKITLLKHPLFVDNHEKLLKINLQDQFPKTIIVHGPDSSIFTILTPDIYIKGICVGEIKCKRKKNLSSRDKMQILNYVLYFKVPGFLVLFDPNDVVARVRWYYIDSNRAVVIENPGWELILAHDGSNKDKKHLHKEISPVSAPAPSRVLRRPPSTLKAPRRPSSPKVLKFPQSTSRVLRSSSPSKVLRRPPSTSKVLRKPLSPPTVLRGSPSISKVLRSSSPSRVLRRSPSTLKVSRRPLSPPRVRRGPPSTSRILRSPQSSTRILRSPSSTSSYFIRPASPPRFLERSFSPPRFLERSFAPPSLPPTWISTPPRGKPKKGSGIKIVAATLGVGALLAGLLYLYRNRIKQEVSEIAEMKLHRVKSVLWPINIWDEYMPWRRLCLLYPRFMSVGLKIIK